MKRTPIRARRATPRRMTGRTDHPASQPWPAVREVIYWRAGGLCEVCGSNLHGRMDGHHRLRRRYGPDCPCNALALCDRCHDLVHAHPIAAGEDGRMLSSTSPTIPGDVPVRVNVRGRGPTLVLLTCDGQYRFDLTDAGPAGSVDLDHPSREGATREDTP